MNARTNAPDSNNRGNTMDNSMGSLPSTPTVGTVGSVSSLGGNPFTDTPKAPSNPVVHILQSPEAPMTGLKVSDLSSKRELKTLYDCLSIEKERSWAQQCREVISIKIYCFLFYELCI
jgi:hypothetical protein